MDVREYLERIRIAKAEEPTYSFLEKLSAHHLLTVPFENMDIRQGIPIVLEEDHLYKKIAVRGRGGFCYELNGLFRWLLHNLGFTVSMASARVYISAEDRFTPEFDHMVLLVSLDDTYLVDVGFGYSFRKPIPIPEGQVEDVGGKYRIQAMSKDQDVYLVQKQEKDGWCPIYRFTTYQRQLSDFKGMCTYHQTSPDSYFTQRTVCTIATEGGRVTLSDNSLTITQDGEKRKLPLSSPEAFGRMLIAHFGLEGA